MLVIKDELRDKLLTSGGL